MEIKNNILDTVVNLGGVSFFARWKYGKEDPMRSMNEQFQMCITNGSSTFKIKLQASPDSTEDLEYLIDYLTGVKEYLENRRINMIESESRMRKEMIKEDNLATDKVLERLNSE
jgi:hypothetical protein